MTTKRQAEICVERNLSDDEIVEMTGCHPECVEFVRAWGRGERVEFLDSCKGWIQITSGFDLTFKSACNYRLAPRRIHVKATLPDGTEREAEFPEPVREAMDYGKVYWVSCMDGSPTDLIWHGVSYDRRKLREGLVFRTCEEAKERDKAMIWISGGEVE